MRSGTKSLLLGTLATFAAAGSPRAADCAKAMTRTDRNICTAQSRAAADEALDAAHGDLVEEPLMADRLVKLRAAERSWVAYRDAQCAFVGSGYEGGSMHPMAVDGCAETPTRRQIAELTKALSCAKDGAGC